MAVAKAALEMEEKKIEFSKQAKGELAILEQAVLDIVDRTISAYGSFDLPLSPSASTGTRPSTHSPKKTKMKSAGGSPVDFALNKLLLVDD